MALRLIHLLERRRLRNLESLVGRSGGILRYEVLDIPLLDKAMLGLYAYMIIIILDMTFRMSSRALKTKGTHLLNKTYL